MRASDERRGERHENDQRGAEAIEPQFLEVADQGVEEVAERDSRGERSDSRTEQVQDIAERRQQDAPEQDLALDAQGDRLTQAPRRRGSAE